MSRLQFICGCAGSGKSTWAYDHVIRQSEKEPDRNFLIIVPEQFTMETQKALVTCFPGNSIMNIDVLSFDRLAFRVFDDLGLTDFRILEETGKNLVLRKVAQEKSEELTMLRSNLRGMGTLTELKSLISEFMQYQVTPEILEDLIKTQKGTPAFLYKLQDILTVYRGFEEYLRGVYITAEEVLGLLIEKAEESALIKDSVIVLDGFTGFTPIQNQLLERIFPLVSEVYVTVTVDEETDLFKKPVLSDLFYLSEKTVYTLLRIAEDTDTEVKKPLWLPGAKEKRFVHAPELSFLEQCLFRKRAVYEGASDQQGTHQIRLCALSNPKEELTFAVSEIHRLVRTEGYRFRDFAIVSGDLATYATYAEEVFRRFSVPVFLDQKRSILFSPLTEMLRGILSILRTSFAPESVFHYLRTGLSGIPEEMTDLLETYVLANGIRGNMWKQRWARKPEKITEEDLEELNALRERIVQDLAPLEEVFSKENRAAEAECRAIYDFLLAHHVEEQMLAASDRFLTQNKLEKSREYERIYGIVINLLDKIATLLAEESLSPEEFSEIFDAGLEEADVGLIPPGYDRVTLGDMERTRLSEIKILFFIGMNDGIIPKGSPSGGMISELEREYFEEAGIALSPSPKERAFIQRFYLYSNLTKPSRELILTFRHTDAEGKSRRPSYLIGMLQKLFPKISVEEPESAQYLLETPESAERLFLSGFDRLREGKPENLFLTLYRWFLKHGADKAYPARMLSAAFSKSQPDRISRETAKNLYGKVLMGAATKMEQFASCAFRYFVRYGLKLSERDLHELGAPDIGNVYHLALEHYGAYLAEDQKSWSSVTDEESMRYAEKALSEAVLSLKKGDFYADAKGKYDLARMQRILKRSVRTLTAQLRAGRFSPELYEAAFGPDSDLAAAKFSLGEGERLLLSGRIDRLDTYADGDDLFVKVLDYKSGNAVYSLPEIYEGLQLQLVLYMAAAEELMQKRYPGKTIHPAGMFFCHLEDPILTEEKEITEEEAERNLLKEMRPDGMINADPEAIAALDSCFEDASFAGRSDVIKVGKKKDGSYLEHSAVMEETDFHTVEQFTRERITAFAKEILSGNIKASPCVTKDKNPCTVCGYRAICGFHEGMTDAIRQVEAAEDTEILSRMRSALRKSGTAGRNETSDE